MSNDADQGAVSAGGRLIVDAYRDAAHHRERAELAPFVPDRVVDSELAEAEYFAAVMEYYSRLEPHLVNRPYYWREVPLFSHPDVADRESVVRALAEYYGLDMTDALDVVDAIEAAEGDVFDEVAPTDGTVRGLRALQLWRARERPVERREYDVVDGEQVWTETVPEYLPREVTLQVHTLLDEAAAKLGFGPEGKVPEMWEEEPI